MQELAINFRRIILRDFSEADRPAFIKYQTDPRYRHLYDFDDNPERADKLFDLFLQWQQERPRMNTQLAICEIGSERLLGSGGLRKIEHGVAVFGIELAPTEWGRFRVAIDASSALLRYGFETLNLKAIIGDTASGNRRIEKLARWFGAKIVARRPGPDWMQVRGWQEVDWEITREMWEQSPPASKDPLVARA